MSSRRAFTCSAVAVSGSFWATTADTAVSDIAYLRFAPAPNGNWFPWSPSCPYACGPQYINQTTASYVRMWNYVVGKIRDPKYKLTEDVLQIIFDAAAIDEGGKLEDFVPSLTNGTRPNWWSITGINWGNTLPGNSWVNVTQLFGGMHDRLKALNSTMPRAIVSAATTSAPNGITAKNAWLKDLCDFSKAHLKMVSYHNVDTSTTADTAVFGGEKGVRNYTSPFSQDQYREYPAWRECVIQPEFVGSNYSSYTVLINQTIFKGLL